MTLTDLWTEASIDHDAVAQQRRVAACRAAALPIWPVLAAATSAQDYVNRKAVVADRLDKAVAAVVQDPAMFAVARAELEATYDADYEVLARARAHEAHQRQAAQRRQRLFEATQAKVAGGLENLGDERAPEFGKDDEEKKESSLKLTAEQIRNMSPQAWRRLKSTMTEGELRDLAKDLAAETGADAAALEAALLSTDWESRRQALLQVEGYGGPLTHLWNKLTGESDEDAEAIHDAGERSSDYMHDEQRRQRERNRYSSLLPFNHDGFQFGMDAARWGLTATSAKVPVDIEASSPGFAHSFFAGINAFLRQGKFQKGAPFADYEDFDACVKANSDKDDPDAYCGKIKHETEDKKESARASKLAAPWPVNDAGKEINASPTLPYGRPEFDGFYTHTDGYWHGPYSSREQADPSGSHYVTELRDGKQVWQGPGGPDPGDERYTVGARTADLNPGEAVPCHHCGLPVTPDDPGYDPAWGDVQIHQHCVGPAEEQRQAEQLAGHQKWWDAMDPEFRKGYEDMGLTRDNYRRASRRTDAAKTAVNLGDPSGTVKVGDDVIAGSAHEGVDPATTVTKVVVHPPGTAPAEAPIVKDMTVVEVQTGNGNTRWLGATEVTQDADGTVHWSRPDTRAQASKPHIADAFIRTEAGKVRAYVDEQPLGEYDDEIAAEQALATRMAATGSWKPVWAVTGTSAADYAFDQRIVSSQHYAAMRSLAGENPFAKKDDDGGDDKPSDDGGGDADKQPTGDLDPTQMQPGQKLTLNYTLTGANPGNGSTEATFDSTDGTSYFFTYSKGRFAVTQQGDKWVDSVGTEFTFAAADDTVQDPTQPIDPATQAPAQQQPATASLDEEKGLFRRFLAWVRDDGIGKEANPYTDQNPYSAGPSMQDAAPSTPATTAPTPAAQSTPAPGGQEAETTRPRQTPSAPPPPAPAAPMQPQVGTPGGPGTAEYGMSASPKELFTGGLTDQSQVHNMAAIRPDPTWSPRMVAAWHQDQAEAWARVASRVPRSDAVHPRQEA